MKALRLLILAALVSLTALAAIDPFKVIPTLTLNNGTVLRNVQIVSYSSGAVMARWEGGRGTIANAQLPAELRAMVSAHQQAQSTPSLRPPSRLPPVSSRLKPMPPLKAAPEAKRRVITGKVDIANKDGGMLRPSGLEIFLVTDRQKESIAADFSRARSDRQGRAMSNEQLYDAWKLPALFTARAYTDTEGSFTIDLPDDGNFWVFAKLQVTPGTNGEYYVWLLSARSGFGSSGLNLNPANSLNYRGLFTH